MRDFFTAFDKVSKDEWTQKLIADLKGKDPSILQNDDEIEEFSLSTFYHQEDLSTTGEAPGNFPFTRGMNTPDNQWKNGSLIYIQNETEGNKKALKALNSGADLLVFKPQKENIDWANLLKDIQFEYINTQFVISSLEELTAIQKIVPASRNIQYNIDFLENWDTSFFTEAAALFKNDQQAFCSVNGFKIQRCGATTWQEIAFCLSTGHFYLTELMKQGFTIDEAAACITFNIGIGSNYFYEIAKFRSLKKLWAKIIGAYTPEHSCSYSCAITAVTGNMNKSLQDPYTNLLRQTTEAMSAINGGANNLVVVPYDFYSTNGSSELAERMALNISSILQEESYLNTVIDPSGGSYAVETITEVIGKKAWSLFQELDKNNGIIDGGIQASLRSQILEKRALRIEKFNAGEIMGIGINKYPNIDKVEGTWAELPDYLEMPQLIFENTYKTAEV